MQGCEVWWSEWRGDHAIWRHSDSCAKSRHKLDVHDVGAADILVVILVITFFLGFVHRRKPSGSWSAPPGGSMQQAGLVRHIDLADKAKDQMYRSWTQEMQGKSLQAPKARRRRAARQEGRITGSACKISLDAAGGCSQHAGDESCYTVVGELERQSF